MIHHLYGIAKEHIPITSTEAKREIGKNLLNDFLGRKTTDNQGAITKMIRIRLGILIKAPLFIRFIFESQLYTKYQTNLQISAPFNPLLLQLPRQGVPKGDFRFPQLIRLDTR